MYAKLVNGTLRSSPKKVTHNGHLVYNPPPEILLKHGYLPVTKTTMPTDTPEGQHYESSWTQTETEILQVWTLVNDPVYPEPEPTMADLESAIERGLTT